MGVRLREVYVMGVVLVIIGGLVAGSATMRLFDEGARFRHVFYVVMGFWLALIGVLVW